ncbi:MAG TPA: helix-turn-helix domain-containing protein [Streptomyces sp.]|nr:helix-turn-helix domain-containing protein [Streptomyces sp.]
MQSLLLRLSALDADAENAVRVISFFDRMITGRVGLDTVVRNTALLAERPAGVSAPGLGVSLRADPQGEVVASGRVPVGAARRELDGGTVVWVSAEDTPSPLSDMLLERFAIAVALLLDHTGVPLPELGDPALVELVLSEGVGTAERARALHLLGVDPAADLRVVAESGPAAVEGRAAVLGALRAVLHTGELPGPPPVGTRLGVGPQVPAIDVARSWQAARTAVRFTSASDPVVWWERLGGLAVLADRLDHPQLAGVADVVALDRLAAEPHGRESVAVLEALCATGSARKAATSLHRHHSTVPARLAHAESVLGFPLATPAGRFRLHLALMLRNLRDTAEHLGSTAPVPESPPSGGS